ncbi:protein FAR1-RELATED SEQUENCE 5-like [Mercurialis annua]|uniref:protein FAR1-RELATED SEQUENCE 5-like n=1 Tax=Mercurialis annua TaxID=3986 RepID=UPI00215EBB31|nr:protein FAR1-RELATED SEQUENCE 5-like [Mercurialis annua]
MATLKVVMYYNGFWDEDFNYSNFKIKGILVKHDVDFETLKTLIYGVLNVNYGETELHIKYQLEPNQQAVDIDDNESLRFYIELKRDDVRITCFPLCITTRRYETQNFNEINTVETVDEMNEDKNENSYSSHTSMDIVSYAEMIFKQTKLEEEEGTTIEDGDNEIVSSPKVKKIFKGQVFKDKQIMKSCLCFFAIENNFQFAASKSCKLEYVIHCLDDNCNWRLRASRDGKTSMFVIRRMDNIHPCPPNIRTEEQRQATSSVIGDLIKSKFMNIKTVYTPADIISDIQRDYGVILNYNKAWRSRGKALELLRGEPRDSYSILPSSLNMLMKTNPGSVVELKISEGNTFQSVFIALSASIKGWNFCRPVIAVDGTFLKSTYGGTLLTASTQDSGGKIFPLAFCVVDSENDESWQYFFEKIKGAFGEKEKLCIVSDRHDSIRKAVSSIFPLATHGICAYHLLCNVQRHFKTNPKSLKDCFFGAAKAYTIKSFDYFMGELDSINVGIRPYLDDIGFETWARAHSTDNRYSTMTSNIAESINAAIKSVRELPIATLLEYLRVLVQEWSNKNRNLASYTMTKLTSKAEEALRDNYAISQRMKVIPSVTSIYSVEDGDKTLIVNLIEKTCTCCRFQKDELPCARAIAIFCKYHMDPYQYCSAFFTKENLVKIYEAIVYPMPSQSDWDETEESEAIEVLSPIGKIPPGKPKKQRMKGASKGRDKYKCSKCEKRGHNKKTCRNLAK